MANEERETIALIGSDKFEGTAVYGADDKQIGSIERVMIDKRCGPALRQYALQDTFGPSFKVSPYFRLTSACAYFSVLLYGAPKKQSGTKGRFLAVVSTFVTPSDCSRIFQQKRQLGRLYPVTELGMRGTNWTPSIVPADGEDTVYFFG